MFRLKRLSYYLGATVLASYAAYDFFTYSFTYRSDWLRFAFKLFYVASLGNYIYSLLYAIELITGKPIREIESQWIYFNDKPITKCLVSLFLMAIFMAMLMLPIVIGGVLSQLLK